MLRCRQPSTISGVVIDEDHHRVPRSRLSARSSRQHPHRNTPKRDRLILAHDGDAVGFAAGLLLVDAGGTAGGEDLPAPERLGDLFLTSS